MRFRPVVRYYIYRQYCLCFLFLWLLRQEVSPQWSRIHLTTFIAICSNIKDNVHAMKCSIYWCSLNVPSLDVGMIDMWLGGGLVFMVCMRASLCVCWDLLLVCRIETVLGSTDWCEPRLCFEPQHQSRIATARLAYATVCIGSELHINFFTCS